METENQRCPVCGYDNRLRTNGSGKLPFSIVKNRYVIGKALGRGGFGITYIGMDLLLERRIAIKEYFPGELISRAEGQSYLVAYDDQSQLAFEKGLERSITEARTIAKLNNVPDIVNVFDVFRANSTLYIVMEYIQGETLRARVASAGGRIAPAALMRMLGPIFSALTQVHGKRIIHRDISPDNIMFRADTGRAVLLDFGAANHYQTDVESDHSTNLRPGYAPPEQYRTNSVQDARTDEYALCGTLYYALTGQKPLASLERAYDNDDLQPPSALGVAIAPAFEAALMKGLSLNAKDRYADIATLEKALTEALPADANRSGEPQTTPEIKPQPITPKLDDPQRQTDEPDYEKTIAYPENELSQQILPNEPSNPDSEIGHTEIAEHTILSDTPFEDEEEDGSELNPEAFRQGKRLSTEQTQVGKEIKADPTPEPKDKKDIQDPQDGPEPAPKTKKRGASRLAGLIVGGLAVLAYLVANCGNPISYGVQILVYLFTYLIAFRLYIRRNRQARAEANAPLSTGYLLRLIAGMALTAIAMWLWFAWTVTHVATLWIAVPQVAVYLACIHIIFHSPIVKPQNHGRKQLALCLIAVIPWTVGGLLLAGHSLLWVRAAALSATYLVSYWLLGSRLTDRPIRGTGHQLYLTFAVCVHALILLLSAMVWEIACVACGVTALAMLAGILGFKPEKQMNKALRIVLQSLLALALAMALLFEIGEVQSSDQSFGEPFNLYTFEPYQDGIALTGYCLPAKVLNIPAEYNGLPVRFITNEFLNKNGDQIYIAGLERACSALSEWLIQPERIHFPTTLTGISNYTFNGYPDLEYDAEDVDSLRFGPGEYSIYEYLRAGIDESDNVRVIGSNLVGFTADGLDAYNPKTVKSGKQSLRYFIYDHINYICRHAYVPNGRESTEMVDIRFPNLEGIAPFGLSDYHAYQLTIPQDAYLASNSLSGVTVEDTLTLESNVTAATQALAGCNVTNLTIGENVTLGADSFTASGSGNNGYGTVKDTITIGKGLTLENGCLEITGFEGTLVLEKGATLPTLKRLFEKSYRYKLVCDKGAILDGNIPDGVKVKYRK